MTIMAAIGNLATAVDEGEGLVQGASGAMAQAARDGDAGGVAEQIGPLTSGMAVMKLSMGQMSTLSSTMVELGQTAGRAGG